MLDLSEQQIVILAAMFIAIVAASWKQQYQALFYLLAVVYACSTVPQFMLASFIFLVGLLASGFIRGSAKS